MDKEMQNLRQTDKKKPKELIHESTNSPARRAGKWLVRRGMQRWQKLREPEVQGRLR